MDNYLTTQQLAEKTGYKVSYIRKLCEMKKLPHSKPTGRKILFSEADLKDILEKTRRAAYYEL